MTAAPTSVDLNDLHRAILDAHTGIRPQVPVSPLERSAQLSSALGCEVWLKCDHLLPVGAFKIRGATNKIRVLGHAARDTGVVTASTGNHGVASARAAALAGVPLTVYVPAHAPRIKLDAIERAGAKLVRVDGSAGQAEGLARRHGEREGIPFMSPYNDFHVVAGQGTIGVEIAEQARVAGLGEFDAVFVNVGGGGLVSGLGTAIRHLSPSTRVVGAWPENSPCMLRALEAGRIVDVEERDTLSEASTGAVEAGSITFPICQAVIDERITVSEPEIARAMRDFAETEHWIVEGTAGVALAGVARQRERWRGKKVAVVVCGRNISLELFLRAMDAAG